MVNDEATYSQRDAIVTFTVCTWWPWQNPLVLHTRNCLVGISGWPMCMGHRPPCSVISWNRVGVAIFPRKKGGGCPSGQGVVVYWLVCRQFNLFLEKGKYHVFCLNEMPFIVVISQKEIKLTFLRKVTDFHHCSECVALKETAHALCGY